MLDPTVINHHIPGLHEYLHSSINPTDLTEEADKCHGYHASVAQVISMAEIAEDSASLNCDQVRTNFADTLANEKGGKVTDAEVNRKVVCVEEFLKAKSIKHQASASQTLFKGLLRNLEMRHAVVVALINRSNAELRSQRV